MGNRENVIKVSLSDGELAVLDERRGEVARAVYLRRLLHGPESAPDVCTRTEAMGLLSELARERRTQAVIALARELREGADSDAMTWILEGGRRVVPGDHTNRHPPPNWHQDTLGLLITLSLGPGPADGEWSEAQLRRGWAVYRERVMRQPANSTRPDRPWAWWVFDLGEPMPEHYPRRLARLLELGELSEDEVVYARERVQAALEGA